MFSRPTSAGVAASSARPHRAEETVPHRQQIDGRQRRRRQHGVEAQADEADAAGRAREQDQPAPLIAIRQHAAHQQPGEHAAAGQRHRQTDLQGGAGQRLDLHRNGDRHQSQRHNGNKARAEHRAESPVGFQQAKIKQDGGFATHRLFTTSLNGDSAVAGRYASTDGEINNDNKTH